MELHDNFENKIGFKSILGILKSNAIYMGSNLKLIALYKTICLINHCSKPNVDWNYNNELESQTVFAIRDINEGEELLSN